MAESMQGLKRTHRCGELSAGDIVRLKGVAFAAERFSGESFALAIPWLMEQTGLAPFDLFSGACRSLPDDLEPSWR